MEEDEFPYNSEGYAYNTPRSWDYYSNGDWDLIRNEVLKRYQESMDEENEETYRYQYNKDDYPIPVYEERELDEMRFIDDEGCIVDFCLYARKRCDGRGDICKMCDLAVEQTVVTEGAAFERYTQIKDENGLPVHHKETIYVIEDPSVEEERLTRDRCFLLSGDISDVFEPGDDGLMVMPHRYDIDGNRLP